MNKEYIPNGTSFFAAQNSYNGFISHFQKVFNSREFTRIYVLKGGPGTGKSSLMKKLYKRFNTDGVTRYAIYCSSDTNSFDGLIVQKGDKKIAVLDGTSPHERDAVVPGAIDELINLGNCWKRDELIKERDSILDLNTKKSAHYKKAYEFLSVAGGFADLIYESVTSAYDFDSARGLASYLVEDINDIGMENEILISAFGKSGYSTTGTFDSVSNKKIGIFGKCGTDLLFINLIRGTLKDKNIRSVSCIYPLDKKQTEAVYLPGNKTLFYKSFDGEINAEQFLKLTSSDMMRISEYCADEIKYRNLAQKEFKMASDLHFKLEDIYTPCMDFEKLNTVYSEISEDISKILEL